jgi:hypothetical protein
MRVQTFIGYVAVLTLGMCIGYTIRDIKAPMRWRQIRDMKIRRTSSGAVNDPSSSLRTPGRCAEFKLKGSSALDCSTVTSTDKFFECHKNRVKHHYKSQPVLPIINPFKVKRLHDRDDMGQFLDSLGIKGAGLEIGVRDGDYASQMLTKWKGCTHYILVDPWEAIQDGSYKDGANVDAGHHDQKYSFVKKNVVENPKYCGKVSMLRMFSSKAAPLIPDNSLAFVYVDGNHWYDFVKNDIHDFWAKLAPGGMMAGHDFTNHYEKGVKRAVIEFTKAHGLKLFVTDVQTVREDITGLAANAKPACCPTFYFFKPKHGKGTGYAVDDGEGGKSTDLSGPDP